MTVETSEPVGALTVALAHGERLLSKSPTLAKDQAEEILKVLPGQREAILLLARAHAALGDPAAAVALLRPLTQADPKDPAAWRLLADMLHLSGQVEEADAAHLRAVNAAITDPVLMNAALALREGRLNVAETALRERLKAQPTDVAAIRMFAEVAAQLGRYQDAVNLLSRCLELSPSFHDARRAYAQVLLRHERPVEALIEADRLIAIRPDDVSYAMLKAAILARLGDHGAAAALYDDMLRREPQNPKAWMSYGHVLKTVGRGADGVAAYRRAVEQSPELGEAWWSLANLKTFRFTSADLDILRAQLARGDLDEADRLHLHFALAKGLEDLGDYEAAFAQYGLGNAIRRDQLRYEAAETTQYVERARARFDRAFFDQRRGGGCPARDPIFIVGLPRSGSTLVEQILSSHSQIEGTAELPDLMAIARRIAGAEGAGAKPSEALAALSANELADLGAEYLERTRIQRKTDRPLFIDKLPNNWMHVGLIQLILPQATIIDARRHPLGCCLSGFKQHFARGQGFTYDLTDIGLYYRDYVALMAHFDSVLPGRVHRVIYERMIADTEARFGAFWIMWACRSNPPAWNSGPPTGPCATASSEQVRQTDLRRGGGSLGAISSPGWTRSRPPLGRSWRPIRTRLVDTSGIDTLPNPHTEAPAQRASKHATAAA